MIVRAAVLTLLLALAACTPSGMPARSDDARQGILRTAATVEIPGFNPMVHDNAYTFYYAPLVFDFLLSLDAKGNLIPDLATAVPTRANGGFSADGTTVTYHLRRGVKWHDGAAFDARDVLFSQSAVMNRANAIPDRTGYDQVASIAAPDPYTVVVHIKHASTTFLPSFFTVGANDPYPILPAHLLAHEADLNRDAFDSHPVGTGPFRLTRWERGSRMTFEANTSYFAGAPHLHRIDVALIPDSNTLANLWKTGGIDMREIRTGNGRPFYDAVTSTPGTHVVTADHYEFEYFMMNQTHAPLDDVNVRRAVIQAFDSVTAMRELQGALALPGETDRLPGTFAYDASIRQPACDPAAAARTLDADGWRLGVGGVRYRGGKALELQIVGTTENKTDQKITLLLQQALQHAGFRVDIKDFAYDQLWAPKSQHGIYASQRFDLSYTGWQPGAVHDHSYLFRCDTRPPNGDNYGGICDPQIDAAARTELTAVDPAREAAADRIITRRLVAQSDLFFLGFDREAIAYRDGLSGFAPSVTGMHAWNAREWGWSP